ncbi:MAG: glycosyltransferase [Cellulophaga sp.]
MKNQYYIVAPCYNESNVINLFLKEIESKLRGSKFYFTIVIVDDASIDDSAKILSKFEFESSKFSLKVIRLEYNMGHQAAINTGLNYVNNFRNKLKGVIVMDSDGEDDPNAINELTSFNDFDIVLVVRGKRKEGRFFKLGYFAYKLLFRIVTGKRINFGNFSLISPEVLKCIHNQRFLHYPAFLSKQKFNIDKIVYNRQDRMNGKSKMSKKGLVFHGLLSMIEYSEEILFFLIKVFFVTFIISSIHGIYIIYSKFILKNAILGWASSVGASLIIICLLIINTIIIGLLLISIKKTIASKINAYEEIR